MPLNIHSLSHELIKSVFDIFIRRPFSIPIDMVPLKRFLTTMCYMVEQWQTSGAYNVKYGRFTKDCVE